MNWINQEVLVHIYSIILISAGWIITGIIVLVLEYKYLKLKKISHLRENIIPAAVPNVTNTTATITSNGSLSGLEKATESKKVSPNPPKTNTRPAMIIFLVFILALLVVVILVPFNIVLFSCIGLFSLISAIVAIRKILLVKLTCFNKSNNDNNDCHQMQTESKRTIDVHKNN